MGRIWSKRGDRLATPSIISICFPDLCVPRVLTTEEHFRNAAAEDLKPGN